MVIKNVKNVNLEDLNEKKNSSLFFKLKIVLLFLSSEFCIVFGLFWRDSPVGKFQRIKVNFFRRFF